MVYAINLRIDPLPDEARVHVTTVEKTPSSLTPHSEHSGKHGDVEAAVEAKNMSEEIAPPHGGGTTNVE